MTENEAKSKWCPMAKAANDSHKNTISTNMDKDNQPSRGCWCIASNCMMWVPYEHWIDNKGGAWLAQNREKTLTKVVGGDCGLKNYE